jgi:hypothetical protein
MVSVVALRQAQGDNDYVMVSLSNHDKFTMTGRASGDF